MSSCAGTQIQSSKPEGIKIPELRKIIVVVPCGDLKERSQAEGIFSKDLSRTSLKGVSYLTLFPPGKTYSNQESETLLNNNGIDGTLVVIKTSEFRSERYVSPQFFDMAVMSGSRDMFYGTPFQGYTLSEGVTDYSISLLDRENNVVWRAKATTKGTRKKMIYQSLAKTTIKELRSSGFLR